MLGPGGACPAPSLTSNGDGRQPSEHAVAGCRATFHHAPLASAPSWARTARSTFAAALPLTAPATTSWFDQNRGRLEWVVAGVLVLLAAALRLPGLGEYWLNPDEGIYYSVIAWPDLARRNAEIAANAHPPLYYHLLWLWSRVSMDIAWLRVPAALAGTAAVAATYLLGRGLAPGAKGVAVGGLAALLLAVSPSAITLSQLVRPYALQVALLCFALLGLLRFHHGRGRGTLVLFSACATVALLTHYSSVFALAAAGVQFVVLAVRRRLPARALVDLAVAACVPLATLAWIYFAHVRPQLEGQALQQEAFATWLSPFLARDLAHVWRQALGVSGYVLGDAWSGAGIVVLLAALAVAAWRRTPRVYVAPAVAFGLAAAASLLGKYPFGPARHSVWLAPFLLLPIAWVVVQGLGATRLVRAGTVVALVLLAVGRYEIYETLAGGKRVSTLGEEKVLAREDLAKAQPVLAQLKDTPGLLATSVDGYHTLCPLWREERTHAREVDGMRVFRWGRRDVVVHSEWAFSIQGSDVRKDAHLYGFLAKAERVLPELQVTRQRRLPILFAGFHGLTMKALVDLDAQRRATERWVVSCTGVKGLGVLELDAALFFRDASAELARLPGPEGGAGGR